MILQNRKLHWWIILSIMLFIVIGVCAGGAYWLAYEPDDPSYYVGLLKSSRVMTQKRGMDRLVRMDGRAVPSLIVALGDEETRQAANRCLFRIGPNCILSLIDEKGNANKLIRFEVAC